MNNRGSAQNYDDIIKLKRPVSKYPKMPIEKRAAQFAPFAALTSYHEIIAKTENAEFYSGQEIIDDLDNEADIANNHLCE